MKTFTSILFLALALSGRAQTRTWTGADPSGHWQWAIPGPNGTTDATAVFACKDGALTGTLTVMGNDEIIFEGSCKDGVLAFTVVRRLDGDTFIIKYAGKLDGDTIKGTVDRPIGDGERKTYDWTATRAH